MIRWKALKGITAIILFLIIAALVEYVAVLYAISQGVSDVAGLQYSFRFPSTDWTATIAVSPLFHIVPVAVVISLASCWTYLTRKIAVKHEKGKVKVETSGKLKKQINKRKSKISRTLSNFTKKVRSGLSKVRGVSYLWQKVHFARATLRSALAVLSTFMLFVLVFILLTYPQLIYRSVGSAYQDNSLLYNFVTSVDNSAKGFAEAVSPLGWIANAVNNVLVGAAPAVKSFGLAFGNLIKPLADLNNAAKYLVFQNAAAWMSVIVVLFYGEYWRKGYRYRKK
jgi:hypothetical protein